jgi:hypothetical protein
LPRGPGPALTLVDPSWDQGLVGAGQAAQFRHGLPLPPILPALVVAGAQCEPGGLGEQVGAVARDLSQFGRSGGLLRLSQAAPPGMPPGGAVKRGRSQPVRARSGAIPGHLARIEHGDGKGKSAAFVSACRAAGKARVMEALTPASPDSLPPLGELIADEPSWQYPASLTAGPGVAHLRVWLTGDPEPGHLAAVTETGSAARVQYRTVLVPPGGRTASAGGNQPGPAGQVTAKPSRPGGSYTLVLYRRTLAQLCRCASSRWSASLLACPRK